jgi:uncharacterized membrane protein YfcA
MTEAVAVAWQGTDAGGFALLALVTFIAAAVNSVAGGGTILTFPALTAILPPGADRLVIANATSTIGLWPGAVSAAWAYRGERAGQPGFTRWLVVPSIVGALVGAWLVVVLPPEWFAALVPWLILVAAVLFALQPQIVGLASRLSGPAADRPAAGPAASLPLACLPDAEVRVRQFGDRSATTEQGLGVAAHAGLDDGALHVGLHVRERHEVRIENDRCLVGGDAEPLAETVGLHAVGEAVADHLRLRPLIDGDL